jgi:hypothetical protein
LLLDMYFSNSYGHWGYEYSSNLCIKCSSSSWDHTPQVTSCISMFGNQTSHCI